jgi:hypothetical protein
MRLVGVAEACAAELLAGTVSPIAGSFWRTRQMTPAITPPRAQKENRMSNRARHTKRPYLMSEQRRQAILDAARFRRVEVRRLQILRRQERAPGSGDRVAGGENAL